MILIVNNTMGHQGSFFQKVIGYFRSRQIPHVVVDSLAGLGHVDRAKIKGVILTGSPLMVNSADMGTHPDHFLLNIRALEDFDVPVMGICFGCQLINQLYGGSMVRLGSLFCKDTLLENRIPVRFCLNYVIDKIPPSFELVANAVIRGRTVPAFIKHKTKPIFGCLFHPEYHERTRAAILDRFMNMCNV
jgi:GMP synthase-like glutamine amidotransferase